ncbi:MAG TPA: M48 family metallopeptidase [Terriglobales bacterium]|nr:M48 family metallopeptidase [Terriglobales bacterium]
MRFQSLVIWIAASLLLSSLPVVCARAQDALDPTAKLKMEAQPVAASSDREQSVAIKRKRNKSAAKYDVGRIGRRGIGGGINSYSLEDECELGHELAQDIEMQTRLITDPVIAEYVNRLGQRIVQNSDAQVPFTIKVIESDEINAFALPGGYLYVDTGLIRASDSEAELAGLMAHEVAHVAARHATRAETRMQLWNVLSIALMYFGGPAAAAMRGAVGIAAPASFLKFSRDAEREADLLGLEYEYASGYDPQAFVQFFEKLHTKEKQRQNFVAKAFASHPMTEDRIRRAQQEIASLLPAKDEYIVDTSEFQEVKSRLANLMHEGRTSEDGRPVLHRRGPEDVSSDDETGPTLHRKTD